MQRHIQSLGGRHTPEVTQAATLDSNSQSMRMCVCRSSRLTSRRVIGQHLEHLPSKGNRKIASLTCAVTRRVIPPVFLTATANSSQPIRTLSGSPTLSQPGESPRLSSPNTCKHRRTICLGGVAEHHGGILVFGLVLCFFTLLLS